jgi:hypothetical protein
MDRRAFLVSITGSLLAAPLGAGGQQGGTSPVGVDTIKRVLTGHREWTFYWDRAPLQRPRLSPRMADRSPHATLEFIRVGVKVIGHAKDDRVHHTECDFEVAVGEGGFTFVGCWGSDKTMTYDPDDREYPFKGRVDGTLLWLAPKD